MPFVNIRLYEGHGKERKDELAKRVTEAVHAIERMVGYLPARIEAAAK